MIPRAAHRLLLAGLCLGLFSTANAQEPKVTKPLPALGERVTVNLVAKVEALNLETRELRLKGPTGSVVTLTVDPRVQRLAEVKVGDDLKVAYYVELAAELRPATEAEKKDPLTTHEEVLRLPDGKTPAGGGIKIIKAVVTVEGVDRAAQTVALKGPRGNWANVRVKDPAMFDSLRTGDTVIVTYTEATAVELQKVRDAKSK